MEALGRLFNIVPTADAVEVSLRDATGVTFVCVGADSEDFTVASATDASGTGAANLAVVTRVYRNASAAGANAWTLSEVAATAVVETATANPVAVFHVSANSLPDGHDYVRVSSASTGLVYAIVHDLVVQRDPANLPALAL